MKTLDRSRSRCSARVAAHCASRSPPAVVEGVQMPAWVERGGSRTAARCRAWSCSAGDQVRHRRAARACWCKLAEGSVVKLGENGSCVSPRSTPRRTLFKAALDVLAGRVPLHHRRSSRKAAPPRGRASASPQVTAGHPRHGPVGPLARRARDRLPDRGRDRGRRRRRAAGDHGPAAAVLPARQGQDAAGRLRRRRSSSTSGRRKPRSRRGKGARARGGRFSVRRSRASTDQASALAVYDQLRNAGYPARDLAASRTATRSPTPCASASCRRAPKRRRLPTRSGQVRHHRTEDQRLTWLAAAVGVVGGLALVLALAPALLNTVC